MRWNVPAKPIATTTRYTSANVAWSVHSAMPKPSSTAPAMQPAVMMTRRRSVRSATAPANGSATIIGRNASTPSTPNHISDPVAWYTQIGIAQAVSAEPAVETSCPAEMVRNRRMLGSATRSRSPDRSCRVTLCSHQVGAGSSAAWSDFGRAGSSASDSAAMAGWVRVMISTTSAARYLMK